MGNSIADLLKSFERTAFSSLETIQDLSNNPERFRSVVNGLLGDALAEQKSPLTIPMKLFGEPKGKKLCILVHGLFDMETTWQYRRRPGRDYGSLLKQDCGYQPLYLRYNTGLHISTNGQQFSRRLEKTLERRRTPPGQIVFIGHSMGGLVIRSACHYAQKRRHSWVKKVKKIFFLGTPHLGSDWEKLGHLTNIILKLIPNPITMGLASLGWKRSAGIKDLRFGYLLDEDWKGQNDKALWHDNRHPVPLLKDVDYYVIAAILGKKSKNLLSEYFGDGLVAVRSARGKSFRNSQTLPFQPEHFKSIRGITHTQLAHSRKVYQQIKKWL